MKNQEIIETKIKPLVEQLAIVCNDYKVPMFVTLAVDNTKKGTEYYSRIIDCDMVNETLTDDKFKDLLNVMNNFKTYLPTENEVEEIVF